jgi:hypothetical protein
MRRWAFEQSLTLFFTTIFLLSLVGQSFAGLRAYNAEQVAHDSQTISYWRYLVSSDFGGNVMENWQSEFLQFTLFILATVWLVQRGSPESKKPEEAGGNSDAQAKVGRHAPQRAPRLARFDDWRTRLYENSLVIAMTVIFFASWLAQSLANWTQYNDDQTEHGEAAVTWLQYVRIADFWNRTLQNWQSEFLAIGTMVVFTIYLRQRGSPESKPVGTPHDETAVSN